MDTAADRGPTRTPQPPETPQPPLPPGRAIPHAGGTSAEESFLEPFERVFASLRRLLANYATLAVLDVRRAAVQFAWLIGGGIFATVLLVTAWLAAVVALSVWLFGEGLSWPAVLLIASGLNILGAALVAWRMKAMFEHKPFSALLRQIRSEDGETNTAHRT